MEKILIIIAPKDFRDEEFEVPRRKLEEAGYEIVVASKGVPVASGMLGMSVDVDVDVADIGDISQYKAVILVGGSGASVYFEDPVVHGIIKSTVENGILLGSICISPSTLANAGVLSGKKATAFSSQKEHMESNGVLFTGEPVTVDGKIITADGPVSAEKFTDGILALL